MGWAPKKGAPVAATKRCAPQRMLVHARASEDGGGIVGKCWPASRAGIISLPCRFLLQYREILLSPPTVPSLPLPLAGTPALPAAHYLGIRGAA